MSATRYAVMMLRSSKTVQRISRPFEQDAVAL
jgi:hypothetical protein